MESLVIAPGLSATTPLLIPAKKVYAALGLAKYFREPLASAPHFPEFGRRERMRPRAPSKPDFWLDGVGLTAKRRKVRQTDYGCKGGREQSPDRHQTRLGIPGRNTRNPSAARCD